MALLCARQSGTLIDAPPRHRLTRAVRTHRCGIVRRQMRGKMKSWTEMEMKVEVAVAMSDETMGVSRPVEPNFEVRTWCDELEGDRKWGYVYVLS